MLFRSQEWPGWPGIVAATVLPPLTTLGMLLRTSLPPATVAAPLPSMSEVPIAEVLALNPVPTLA